MVNDDGSKAGSATAGGMAACTMSLSVQNTLNSGFMLCDLSMSFSRALVGFVVECDIGPLNSHAHKPFQVPLYAAFTMFC
jgi:hypothetical protein